MFRSSDGEEIGRAVLSGEAGLSPGVRRRLLERMTTGPSLAPEPQLPDGLTPRELEAPVPIAEGPSDPEAAHLAGHREKATPAISSPGLECTTGHRPFAMRTFGASHSRPDRPSPEEVKTGE
ncbi:hypothetical protein [Streptomyces sp. NPDC005989]|uniref:hypothetical protein n=1 Tax=Streptomyces sp. NPDC005989 TaxID=3156727 RepID=UPI0033F74B44